MDLDINDFDRELKRVPKQIIKDRGNEIVKVYSLYGIREYKYKDLTVKNILKDDLKDFKADYKTDNYTSELQKEGAREQIIRIETTLYNLGYIKKTTFNMVYNKKEYPINVRIMKKLIVLKG